MEVVALVVFLAALYGVRSGYVGAKQTARKALSEWAAGTRPESTWGKRAGMVTGAFGWAAFQGARGFKNSFGPGFWEGAQKAAAWAEDKKVLRTGPAQRIGAHADDRLKRQARKASLEKREHRARFYDPPPARPTPVTDQPIRKAPHRPVELDKGPSAPTAPVDAPPAPSTDEGPQDMQSTWDSVYDMDPKLLFGMGPRDHLPPCGICGAPSSGIAWLAHNKTGAAFLGGPEVPCCNNCDATSYLRNILTTRPKETPAMSDTTVQSLVQYAQSVQADMTAIVDEMQGHADRARQAHELAASHIDGAASANFKSDVVAPLAAIADAMLGFKEASTAMLISASAALDSATQGTNELSKHQNLTDAASGLSGGVNAMADSAAYQDA